MGSNTCVYAVYACMYKSRKPREGGRKKGGTGIIVPRKTGTTLRLSWVVQLASMFPEKKGTDREESNREKKLLSNLAFGILAD